MIPKIIHYCWFGKSELPEDSKAYIEEWKSYNPDWSIVLWNEDNSPMDVPYMRMAFEKRNWSNMTNFIRLHALKEQGGIYMDTDMKLIKPLESLLENECFYGFEEGDANSEVYWVNNAISGSVPGHPFILECYKGLLEKFDGSEMSNLSGPRLTTEMLKTHRNLSGYGFQKLGDVTLYPKEIFYPIHYAEVYKIANLERYIFPETIAIHVWARTWLDQKTLLHIIDDLYKTNHEQQEQIAKLSVAPLDLDKQVGSELSHHIKRIASSQYFSKVVVEDFFHSIHKLERSLEDRSKQIHLLNELSQHLTEKLNSSSSALESEKQNHSIVREEREKLIARIEATEVIINDYKKQLQEQQSQVSRLLAISESQSSENLQLTKLTDSLLKKNEMAATKLNKAETELEKLNKSANHSIGRIKELEGEMARMRDELSQAAGKQSASSSIYEGEIARLHTEIQGMKSAIAWYQSTYEKRSLAGIIKDRLLKPARKQKQVNYRKDDSLEGKIHRYVIGNPLTVKTNDVTEPVSIIMLSYNRIEDTVRAVKNIYAYTTSPFELIILDNNSDIKVKKELKEIAAKYDNIKVVLETSNLGCAKGRSKAARFAKHDYLLFLDNDILVSPYYLENLFAVLYRDGSAAGACCKVVFPNGKIQFNGGRMVLDDKYALYSLYDEGFDFDDPATNRFINCEWIPGGATLWRRKIFEKFGIDEKMKGSFEDNEISYRLTKGGYKLLNSPASIVIHDHYDFKNTQFKQSEAEYFKGRNNQSRIQEALLHFYKKHQLIFSFAWKNNPWDVLWKLNSKEQILQFIHENTPVE
jgi:GT2 family glycosyltransferase